MRKASRTIFTGSMLLILSTIITVSVVRYVVSDPKNVWAEGGQKKAIDGGPLMQSACRKVALTPDKSASAGTDSENLVALVKDIFEAAKQGKWAWLAGLVCMLLTLLVNRIFAWKIPSSVLPWISVALGTISAIAFALAEGQSWPAALGQGATVGLAGAGGWSALGKHFLKSKKDENCLRKTVDSRSLL
jgi:hypothetical protein